jgi:tyrosine-protein phosphatase SIW14
MSRPNVSSKCTPALLLFFSLPAFAGSSVPGIHNFYKVDHHVYRGGQPTGDGLSYLAKLGVKTVLDLREPGRRSALEERAVTALGMQYVNVPMSGLTPPTAEQIAKILALLEDKTSGAVFVHCRRGADRTGAVIGAYRIDFDHWDSARALEEARSDGMAFFQLPRQHYILSFQPLKTGAIDTAKTTDAKASTPAAAVLPAPAAIQ